MEQALSAYDAYIARAGAPDGQLLATVAKADLQRVAQHPGEDQIAWADALERLGRAGDAAALQALKRLAVVPAGPLSPNALAPLVSLARLGDKAAADRLGSLLQAGSEDDKLAALSAIRDARAESQGPRILALLQEVSPAVRSAAASTLGALQYRSALPQVRALLKEPGLVRMHAAVAVKQMGDPSADTEVAAMLRSDIPDIRLMAAEAYRATAKTTQWIPLVRQLLEDRSQGARLGAVKVLAGVDNDVVRPILLRWLDDPNPAYRHEAARILETQGLADLKIARRLLADRADFVRLYGAGAALSLAQRAGK